MQPIVVFTDGACSSNGKRCARASWAIVWPDHPHLDAAGIVPSPPVPTNNRGEMMAIIEALRVCRDALDPTGKVPVTVYSDSMLMLNTITTWMRRWKANGWKKADGSVAANVDLLQILDELVQHRQTLHVKFVRAHTKQRDWASLFNDKVDEMARGALKAAEKKTEADNKEKENDDELDSKPDA